MYNFFNQMILVMLLFPILSCNNGTIHEKIEIMKSSPINLNLENMQCWSNDTLATNRPWESIPLKLCVFVSETFCTSCYLKKMFQWEDFINMEKEKDFYIYYIFEPQDGCEETFHKFFYQAELDHPFYIDKKKEFLLINPHIPQESMFHTFLLDEMNNILLVGDILHNTEIEQQFKKILDEHIKSKQ